MSDIEDPHRARSEPTRGRTRARAKDDTLRGRLRAHDPFELIRWLAMSQPDPRKALAELVQNSLDAGARHIRITRVRIHGEPSLRILDDGEGVIPELSRAEALRYIATHIGHSRKRSLSPEQRLRLMTQGQYGIGLLGFWSLGQSLQMRSSLPGQKPLRLILHRDRDEFTIEPLRGRLPLEGRWTEVIVGGLHREALGALGGRRVADYLGAELRGQLLSRDVVLVVEDRIARGRSPKTIVVRPPRFLGERVEGLTSVAVPGYPHARLELYLSEGAPAEPAAASEGAPGLSLYASGTLVSESFHEMGSLGLDRLPWTDRRLSGIVDYPGFQVPPGSRRGVVVDEASAAFARALASVEPILAGLLESLDRRRADEMDRSLIKDLQRAFRDFYRQRPRYEMLPVRSRKDGADGVPDAGEGEAARADEESAAAMDAGADSLDPVEEPAPDLLPAGPLAMVRVRPSRVQVECDGVRRIRARAEDATGREVEEAVEWNWMLSGDVGILREAGEDRSAVDLSAAPHPASGIVTATARLGERVVVGEATVEVLEEMPAPRGDEGIPEPTLVSQPGAFWRSRMEEGRWQVNVGHPEYRGIADQPALKLRYLAMLFAKEVVLRSSQDPRLERPLEQLVEVAAYADRNLSNRRPGQRRKRDFTPSG